MDEPHPPDASSPRPDRVTALAAFLREHPTLALTAGYLGLIVVGMMYEFWLFWRFRISILYYAEAADFLLVPFREPLVMIVAIAPIYLYRMYIGSAHWVSKKIAAGSTKQASPEVQRFYRKFMKVINALAMVLWSLAATAEFAEFVSNRIRAGKRRSVRVVLVTGGEPIAGTVIGTTSQYVFVYDPKIDHTRIVPVENIAEILVAGKKPKAAR